MDVLPRQTADAVANMSADYLLLEHYPRPERIRFRPFGWSAPAYTFGVSQAWAKYRALVPPEYPLVRRCTGGGLVSHLDDWTFALAIPAGHPLYAADAMASYAAVHDALAAALQAQGQPVKLAPLPAGERPFQSPDACAQRAEPNDLVRSDDGRKVAGIPWSVAARAAGSSRTWTTGRSRWRSPQGTRSTPPTRWRAMRRCTTPWPRRCRPKGSP